MLDCLPIYHWFHCGNPYSGAQGGNPRQKS